MQSLQLHLRERWEIFTWCPSDMPGVPRELVEHALSVDPKAKPVKQPLQWFDEPKRKVIASELHRLENAGFIREIKTSSWVSNPVIVPKKNIDVQRVCVDYTSLNKHCPKDPFPLPCIDQMIDSTVGCVRLSFLDAYLICLKCIYNFWCSMLVFIPFAYCFVTLRGTFMHFPELTY
jgi:hypothetical protein